MTAVYMRCSRSFYRGIAILSLALSMNLAVFATNNRFLQDEAIQAADITVLQDELQLFQSVGDGFALLFAQCEFAECELAASESELNLLLKMLDARLENILSRQKDTETAAQFDQIASRYRHERAKYIVYLEQLSALYESAIELADDLSPLDAAASAKQLEEALIEELLEYEEEILPDEEPEAAWEAGTQ